MTTTVPSGHPGDGRVPSWRRNSDDSQKGRGTPVATPGTCRARVVTFDRRYSLRASTAFCSQFVSQFVGFHAKRGRSPSSNLPTTANIGSGIPSLAMGDQDATVWSWTAREALVLVGDGRGMTGSAHRPRPTSRVVGGRSSRGRR